MFVAKSAQDQCFVRSESDSEIESETLEKTRLCYVPHPEKSIHIPSEHENIIKCVTSLYGGSASQEDMRVYAPEAIYDDRWNYCDTPERIAEHWSDISKVFTCKTVNIEIITDSPYHIIYKQRHEYCSQHLHFSKTVNSLVTLTLNEEGKIRYHKDMWDEDDYNHDGLCKVMKSLSESTQTQPRSNIRRF